MPPRVSDRIPRMSRQPGTTIPTDTLGQILFIGFDGTTLDTATRSLLTRVKPGGIILFRRNIVEPRQTLDLVAELHALYDPAPIVGVDEEGGQVSRLQIIAPSLPPMAEIAARKNHRMRALASTQGRILASLGFDIDFAPVVDLCRTDAPNGIGDRSFGQDPQLAIELAGAYLDGLADAGVAGCLKHFPGLGPTLFDSHHHLPTVQKEAAAFLTEDVQPYRALHQRAAVIMVGHGHYPFLAGDNPIAASLSKEVASDLLRRDVGYAGLALADDLEMKAVSARITWSELAPRAVAAGCDMVLVCRSPEAIAASLDALRAWAASGRLPSDRIAEALERVTRMRATVGAITARRSTAPPEQEFASACSLLRDQVGQVA